MPHYTCPNCGTSVSSAAHPAPAACPGCCALLQPSDNVVQLTPRRERRPAPVVRMPLDAGDYSPAAARHTLRELRPELGEDTFRLCELLVSELVTNVVRHTTATTALARADMRVRMYPDRVRVEVRDDGPRFAAQDAIAAVEDPHSGWGLQLVDDLAHSWGIEPGAQKCVWFELLTESRVPAAQL
jgi:anti-sigma regulatory factor (Ser/Thr protein kinase)